jgi:dimethylhistidine N-methyltransferase
VPDSKPVQYRIVDRRRADSGDDRAEVIAGLLERPARISPKYFYDELGCALYGAICQLPEYYPTRTELEIFREHRSQIADAIGAGAQFVDLGAGDCCKAQSWLPYLRPARYIAVDIAGAEIERALGRMSPDFPEIEMLGVITDFSAGLDLEGVLDERPAAFFYPGSSIGNFTPAEAVSFLATVQAHCARRPGSSLLIGVDGPKDKRLLDAAYDDALGVTAAFNRNALLHLNRRFGFDFAVDAFVHRGFFNEALGRIEMHLESSRAQAVMLGGERRAFAAGERIHTENSYKYLRADFEAVLQEAGFGAVQAWPAGDVAYSVFLAR